MLIEDIPHLEEEEFNALFDILEAYVYGNRNKCQLSQKLIKWEYGGLLIWTL